jgi:hypothetical protein
LRLYKTSNPEEWVSARLKECKGLASSLAACGGSSGGGNSGSGLAQNTGTTPGIFTFVVETTFPGPNNTVVFSVNTNVTVTIQ